MLLYFLWHKPEEGQLLHPQPQDDFPFFLSLYSLKTASTTAAARTAPISSVPQLFTKKSSILLTILPFVTVSPQD